MLSCLAGVLATQAHTAAAQTAGAWTGVIALPTNPVAASLLPNGKILAWSSYSEFLYEGDIGGAASETRTVLFDPITQASTLRIVTNTLSDMFCPGITNLADGRIMVNGGSSSHSANIYDPKADAWSAAAPMNVARGYNADVMLTDGSVMTLGGSWSGLRNDRIAEVWTPSTGWTRRPGISAQPITASDPEDIGLGYVYRGDNHLWLFAVGDGLVFHAGPSAQMNWMTTYEDGATISAGNRGDDASSRPECRRYGENLRHRHQRRHRRPEQPGRGPRDGTHGLPSCVR